MTATMKDAEGGFLTGIRVLEVAHELGEYCGKVLAGLGADVVKVEPLGGEKTRGYGPFYHDKPSPNRSLYFWHYNFGKRGITLDLESEAGVRTFQALARSTDVIIDTRHRDYLSGLGIGYADLRELNPALVYVRISPFGDTGPWADYEASDLIHLALGGVVMNCGYDPTPAGEYDLPPVAPQMWQAYHIAGEVTAIQVVAALCYRQETGRGQALSTSVHDAVSKSTETDMPDWIYTRRPHRRLTCRHSFPQVVEPSQQSTPATPALCAAKDGRWILPYRTYLPGSGGGVDEVVALLKKHGMLDASDEQYTHNAYSASLEVRDRINDLVRRLILGYTYDADIWQEAQELGLPWAPLRRPEENVGETHWAQRETFIDVEYPGIGGAFTQVHAKWVASGLPWRRGPRAPLVGEHTREVLEELAGIADRWPRDPARQLASIQRSAAGAAKLSKRGTPFALWGVRVIDLSWLLASAGAGRFFTALGAEVIKVEHTSKIDIMRLGAALVPVRDADGTPMPASSVPGGLPNVNRSGNFMEINAGKRGISLNLKHPRAKEILTTLLKDADIVVEGFSPGTMERMGFGYDRLREINPRLVYVQQSGMGQRGTYGKLRSFGPTAQAISGISDMSGLPEPFPPAGIGYSFLDWLGAYQMALAMMAGLYRQRETGEGCWIDSSQVEAGIYLTGSAILDHSVNGRDWHRTGNRSPYKAAAPHGIYRTRGVDRWIAIAAFTDAQWTALARALGQLEWTSDDRFTTQPLRLENQDALDALVDAATSTRDGRTLMTVLQAAGVPAGVCETAEDRYEWDPQLSHLGWLTELEQSSIGRWPVKEVPVAFSETPPYIGGFLDRHGPDYAEDNRYVYEDLLGLRPDEREDLARDGVF